MKIDSDFVSIHDICSIVSQHVKRLTLRVNRCDDMKIAIKTLTHLYEIDFKICDSNLLKLSRQMIQYEFIQWENSLKIFL